MNSIENLKLKISKLSEKASLFTDNANKVTTACVEINKSWSGSSLVGHAKYFFHNFQEPQTPERFSIEWGLIHGIPDGWSEKTDEEIRTKIEKDSGVSLDKMKDLAIELDTNFLEIQREAVLHLSENGLPESDVEKIEKFTIKSATDIFNDIFPTKFMTRDSEAATGHYIAPHIYYDAVARFIKVFPSEIKGFLFELEKVARKTISPKSTDDSDTKKTYYIENSIILSLSELKSDKYDLTKLIKLSKELNDNYSLGNYLSCGMLIRAILDHLPPIFDKKTFKEVVNNYGTKSFKDIISPLEDTARKISESYLHNLIQKKELLPNKTQVSFQPNIDVLLSEVIRILSTETK
jgi:hypothetical protein